MIGPAFFTISDTDHDVSHNGVDYCAYFRMTNPPTLTGLVRCSDDLPMDRTYALYWVGAATVQRWEYECLAGANPDHEAQAGYGADREARA